MQDLSFTTPGQFNKQSRLSERMINDFGAVHSAIKRPSGGADTLSEGFLLSEAHMDFKEQYKDPRWQKKRLEIMDRAGFKCEECGEAEKELHVHHLIYDFGADYWDYENTALRCLCSECHRLHHVADNYMKCNYKFMRLKDKKIMILTALKLEGAL